MVSRFHGLILKINFHTIKNIIMYKVFEGRNPFLEKLLFGPNGNKIMKILVKNLDIKLTFSKFL